jgi:hypothetical protein
MTISLAPNTHIGGAESTARAEQLVREADAQRSVGHAGEAVELYLSAHAALPPPSGASAAFKAADLCLRVLNDPRRAPRVLHQTALDAVDYPDSAGSTRMRSLRR